VRLHGHGNQFHEPPILSKKSTHKRMKSANGWLKGSVYSVAISTCYYTTLHPTAGWLLKLSRVGPGRSLDGRPDVAGSGVGGLAGGTLSPGLKKKIPMPQDTAVCRVQSFGWDVKRVSPLRSFKIPWHLL
jgi:hypothetical protein